MLEGGAGPDRVVHLAVDVAEQVEHLEGDVRCGSRLAADRGDEGPRGVGELSQPRLHAPQHQPRLRVLGVAGLDALQKRDRPVLRARERECARRPDEVAPQLVGLGGQHRLARLVVDPRRLGGLSRPQPGGRRLRRLPRRRVELRRIFVVVGLLRQPRGARRVAQLLAAARGPLEVAGLGKHLLQRLDRAGRLDLQVPQQLLAQIGGAGLVDRDRIVDLALAQV